MFQIKAKQICFDEQKKTWKSVIHSYSPQGIQFLNPNFKIKDKKIPQSTKYMQNSSGRFLGIKNENDHILVLGSVLRLFNLVLST